MKGRDAQSGNLRGGGRGDGVAQSRCPASRKCQNENLGGRHAGFENGGGPTGQEGCFSRAWPGDNQLGAVQQGKGTVPVVGVDTFGSHGLTDPRRALCRAWQRDRSLLNNRETDAGFSQCSFGLGEEVFGHVVHTYTVRRRCDRICVMIIRPLISTDVADAVALNNAEVPHVGPTDHEHLTRFLGYPGVAWVVEMNDALTGLLVACEPGSTYESANYRWFDERSDDFIYVDRIVVAPSAKGLGIGRLLYDRLAEAYVGIARQMTCEVNLDPPNEASMAFHEQMGFRQVATKPDGLKTVALLARDLV